MVRCYSVENHDVKAKYRQGRVKDQSKTKTKKKMENQVLYVWKILEQCGA
jgi:hypothetical protein